MRLQPDRDPAAAMLGSVRDQFVDDEAERNGDDGRQSSSIASATIDRSGHSSEDNILEKSKQISSRNA